MPNCAILVGQTTAGAAHSRACHRIDDHLGVAIPETKPINPCSKTDWEGTGIAPDVRRREKFPVTLFQPTIARSRLSKPRRSNVPSTPCPQSAPPITFLARNWQVSSDPMQCKRAPFGVGFECSRQSLQGAPSMDSKKYIA
jgi:hypothetical protein